MYNINSSFLEENMANYANPSEEIVHITEKSSKTSPNEAVDATKTPSKPPKNDHRRRGNKLRTTTEAPTTTTTTSAAEEEVEEYSRETSEEPEPEEIQIESTDSTASQKTTVPVTIKQTTMPSKGVKIAVKTSQATSKPKIIEDKKLVTQTPPPEGGCVARNIEGDWIRHYKNTLFRVG